MSYKSSEKNKEYNRQYYLAHKEQNAQYYIENKNKIRNIQKEYVLKNPEKIKEYNEKYKITDPDWQKRSYKKNNTRKNRILKKYGVTEEMFNEMFNEQNERCKICNKHQSECKITFAIDHCHKTGKIRGLLCNTCNRGLGYLQDDIVLLQNAIIYLKNNL
jgi:hypothetical protein